MGLNSSRFCILAGPRPSVSAIAEGKVFSKYERFKIYSALNKVGIDKDEVYFTNMKQWTRDELNALPNLEVIITMGEEAMCALTGKRGIDKWNLSPLESTHEFNCKKVIPTFDFSRLYRQYDHFMFFYKTFVKAAEHMYPGPWKRNRKDFIIETNPNAELVHKYLSKAPTLSVDIETSRGTINTMGFAWTPHDAVAFQIRPGDINPKQELEFWQACAKYLESPYIKKILQNNVYEGTYFARYGIRMRNVWHDTMWAQKLLYPEFKQGLDVIGRLFTNEPYWKEDGKDWTNIHNWREHLLYNCKDTANTFEAAMNQRQELNKRGLMPYFQDYMMKLAEPVNEMCTTGLRVDAKTKFESEVKIRHEISELVTQISEPINYRSPKQKIELFERKGYKIPKTRNTKGRYTPSVDAISLKKMKGYHPDDTDIDVFLKLAKLEKFLGSYIEFDYHDDGVARYTIKGSGTETLRFSSSTDSWDMGFNAQTIPKKAKKFFIPPAGRAFVQVDLKQAESRYVAYRCGDKDLIRMLEDPNEDIHSYVAANIFNVSVEQVIAEKNAGDPSKRQLGKKSGHGANYSMMSKTFMESCLKEDLLITKKEAEHVLETYHKLFPGIREWHKEVQTKLKTDSWLENPLGFRRYFWGRMDDNTFREAYPFEPQSTIPAITNHLLLYLWDLKEKGEFDIGFHLQCHDSLTLSVTPDLVPDLSRICRDTDLWHPEINLPAGRLVIPTDVEFSANNLSDMTEIGQ